MKKSIIIMLLLLCSVGGAAAQSTLKTAYFMDRMTTRHEFNPALQNEYGYFSIPVLADINFGFNSNLSIDNFLFPLDNGDLATFAHPDVSSSQFLDGLKDNNVISQSLSLSLFSLGFHAFGGFNTLDFSIRESLDVNLKKSLFEFMVGNDSGSYKMGGSTIDLTSWAEFSLGHSRRIGDNLTVGAKFKYLTGLANANFDISTMNVSTSADAISLALKATGNAAIIGLPLSGSLSDLSFDQLDFSNGFNGGLGIDLGATYEWQDFTFSLALVDIGYIKWSAPASTTIDVSASFDGFSGLDLNDMEDSIDKELDDFLSEFDSLEDLSFDSVEKSATWLPTKLNIGAEYRGLCDYVSFGALYTNTFGSVTTTEFMLVATVSPVKWFDIALSGTTSSYGTYWGWAVNFCPRWINFFVGMDSMISTVTPQFIPYGSTNLNFKFGLSFPFGRVHEVN